MIELPQATYQEYSNYSKWNYVDENGTFYNENDPQDYVYFDSTLNLIPLPNNETEVPWASSITMPNFLTYATFYSLTHSQPPFYMLPAFFDVVTSLENDFYVTIIAYVAWSTNISNQTTTNDYLNSLGLDSENLWNDDVFGWSNWKTLKPWVQSLLDYNKSNQINDFEVIDMHFQKDGLIELIQPGSLLYNLTTSIQADMLSRYGTNDPTQLGIIQWISGLVTYSLPLTGTILPINNPYIPLPSFLQLNSTFNTIPEFSYFQIAANLTKVAFSVQNGVDLMNISYSYPRTNLRSLLNLNNLAVLFTNPQYSITYFGLENINQIINLQTYLGYLIQTPVSAYNVTFDGYSLMLSKFSRKSLVSASINLRNDAYWAVPTLLVFSEFKNTSKNCVDWVGAVNSTLASTVCSSSIGWNTTITSTWVNLEVWVKAAFKGQNSQEYSLLSKSIQTSDLDKLLFNNSDNSEYLQQYAIDSLKTTSIHYNCKNEYCDYSELFYSQWNSSLVTLNPPDEIIGLVSSSPTMQKWLPTRYLVPIEWMIYSGNSPSTFAPSFLSYDGFLNPSVIRSFYNTYFQYNPTLNLMKFSKYCQSSDCFTSIYNYLKGIIPGLQFFKTQPVASWIKGYYDPFVGFVASLSIYEGGYPIVSPLIAYVTNSTTVGSPQSAVYSGRLDTKLTKNYYKYYGSEFLKAYSLSYNEYSSTMSSFGYKNVWPADIRIQGGDGGTFGTQISDKDELPVFVGSILRMVNLTYSSSEVYKGLDVSLFLPKPGNFNTSASVPINWMFNQGPHGYDGFMNLTGQYSAPVFLSLPHCYLCEEVAANMFEYYSYSETSYLQNRVYPSPADSPFAYIEPLTGTGVNVGLFFELRVGFFNDYFFRDFKEPVPGKGVSFPIYSLTRSAALTQHQIDKFFGGLQIVRQVISTVFYTGVIAGCAFIIASLIVGILIYRINKFGSWKNPKNTMVKKYLILKDKELE